MASSDAVAKLDPSVPEAEALPSGHRVSVQVGVDGEEVLVHGPEGDVQVRIVLGEGAPVVTLSAAKLQLEAADTVSVSCRKFQVEAREEATIASGGTLDLEAAAEMHLTADSDLKAISPMIWLN
jgi:hypothetical protein